MVQKKALAKKRYTLGSSLNGLKKALFSVIEETTQPVFEKEQRDSPSFCFFLLLILQETTYF
ncbi:MAG: hypothetical protein RIQ78_740 [Bacteroidota bacterium]|jgi:hypothetical protein